MKYSTLARKAVGALRGNQTPAERKAMKKSKRIRVRRAQAKSAGMHRKG